MPSSLTGQQPDVADERVLATVLFTDIVDSTRCAAEIGDRDWHALLDAHDGVVRSQLSRCRGREMNTPGNGFLAMFDGPQRAIRCAMAIRGAVQALGIQVRAGLPTGECEVRAVSRRHRAQDTATHSEINAAMKAVLASVDVPGRRRGWRSSPRY